MEVRWTGASLGDLDDIQDSIAQESPSSACRLTAEIMARTERLLANNAMIGRTGRFRGTRELVIAGTPYIVVYRSGDDIEILAVVHGKRDWPANSTPRSSA